MHVVVILTIASRASSMVGSGTVSTLMSLFPCQQIARMNPPRDVGGKSYDWEAADSLDR